MKTFNDLYKEYGNERKISFMKKADVLAFIEDLNKKHNSEIKEIISLSISQIKTNKCALRFYRDEATQPSPNGECHVGLNEKSLEYKQLTKGILFFERLEELHK